MNEQDQEKAFLREELRATRWEIQQLHNELENHSGARKALWNFLNYGWNSVLRIVRGVYHQHVKNIAQERRTDMLRKAPNFKPYAICLKPAVQPHRPRILHAIPSFATGGSQQLIVDIIEGTSHLYEHEVITHNDWGWLGYTGVPVTEFPHISGRGPIIELLERFQPDIVHVHYWGNWREGYPHWKWYHYVFEAAFTFGCRVVQNCNNPLVPYLDERIDAYVYVSEYAQRYFEADNAKSRVIYPGSNFQLFARSQQELLPSDCIGMVYRLDQDKLNAAAIEPFIEVVKRRPQTKVLIVGSGFFHSYYQQRVQEEGLQDQFEFTGMVSYTDLPAQYRRMTLFVAPVHKESFGQVTPFAMHMRLPVVAYEVGALREILVNDQVLAPTGDVDALASRIITLLDDPEEARSIGLWNHNRAAANFSVEHMTSAYHVLYQELL